jgi:heme-binding NEAT domain protein
MYGDEQFHRLALSLIAKQFHEKKFKTEQRECIFQHMSPCTVLKVSSRFAYMFQATITTNTA